jgi:hypothetical protein
MVVLLDEYRGNLFIMGPTLAVQRGPLSSGLVSSLYSSPSSTPSSDPSTAPVVEDTLDNRAGQCSFRCQAQQLGASQEIDGAVWPLADIAHPLVAIGEQVLLGDNPIAIQYQPHQRLRLQPANE